MNEKQYVKKRQRVAGVKNVPQWRKLGASFKRHREYLFIYLFVYFAGLMDR